MNELKTATKTLRSVAILVLGWTLVVVGLAGLVLPVIPGGLLIALGLAVLSAEHPWLRTALAKLRARFPLLQRRLDHLSRYLENLRGTVPN